MSVPSPRVTVADGWLRLEFGPGRGHADFHLRWLRHNCDLDRHPQTRERLVESCELPDDLVATAAEIDGSHLLVTWAHDGRRSVYSLDWLAEHAYARDRVAVPPPPSDVSALELTWGAEPAGDIVAAALSRLAERGAAVVRRAPRTGCAPEDETEALIEAFDTRGLAVISTHFGRIEDLRTDNSTNTNTDQLGYTDAPVDLHTDQPFIPHPPRFQLLQAIRPATAGGDSRLADARAAAEYLRSVDAEAYHLLTTVPVRFHRKQKAFESVVVTPLLVGEGEAFQIRDSYFTIAPYQLPFDRMEAWYRAVDRFHRLVRDPRYQYQFRLSPGDFVLYNNPRMLHARTAFQGARWVRGIYFNARETANA